MSEKSHGDESEAFLVEEDALRLRCNPLEGHMGIVAPLARWLLPSLRCCLPRSSGFLRASPRVSGISETSRTSLVWIRRALQGRRWRGPWVVQLSNLAFAIVAIFFTGIVFGSVVRSISKKFGNLREKGGPIVSTNHTVILGWSPLGFRILTELAIANENQGKVRGRDSVSGKQGEA